MSWSFIKGQNLATGKNWLGAKLGQEAKLRQGRNLARDKTWPGAKHSEGRNLVRGKT